MYVSDNAPTNAKSNKEKYMSNFINLHSEIGKLNTVMLHKPGVEVEMLIPDYLEHMLFEDTPYVPEARREHDVFAGILRDRGVNVLYLEDLFTESVKDAAVRKKFIEDYLVLANVQAETLKSVLREYLLPLSPKELFYEVCKGVRRKDIKIAGDKKPLPVMVEESYPFYTDPVPSLYFTRDISICIGNGMIVSSMSMPFRKREALLMRYIHDYHKDFAGAPVWYDYTLGYSVEGGDILVLSDKVLAVGYGQRTSLGAIENFAMKLLTEGGYEKILVFNLPKDRLHMHLDVLCTMVDYDKFLTAPQVRNGEFDVYELTLDSHGNLRAENHKDSLDKVFSRALGLPAVQFIQTGGGDPQLSSREHWNMGSNSLAIAPGEIITYGRNEVTNELLTKAGIKVHTIPGGELSRGRGGPRCMSMPINRDRI